MARGVVVARVACVWSAKLLRALASSAQVRSARGRATAAFAARLSRSTALQFVTAATILSTALSTSRYDVHMLQPMGKPLRDHAEDPVVARTQQQSAPQSRSCGS